MIMQLQSSVTWTLGRYSPLMQIEMNYHSVGRSTVEIIPLQLAAAKALTTHLEFLLG